MRGLTARQRQILEVIANFTAQRGFPPTVREVGQLVGISSSSTAEQHIQALARKGYVTRAPRTPRSLRVIRQACGPEIPTVLVHV